MNLSRRTATERIQMSAIGAVVRLEKIESARFVATAIREQRQKQQEAVEGKLQANERGLKELRKMVNDWKGKDIPLQELEAVLLMQEKECKKSRKSVAEARNTRGRTSVKSKKTAETRQVAAYCA
jgi:hypothetical protein